eukprot:6683766-Prymnesium_polylepis.3
MPTSHGTPSTSVQTELRETGSARRPISKLAICPSWRAQLVRAPPVGHLERNKGDERRVEEHRPHRNDPVLDDAARHQRAERPRQPSASVESTAKPRRVRAGNAERGRHVEGAVVGAHIRVQLEPHGAAEP